MEGELRALMGQFPRPGRVEWIGVRPAYREEMAVVSEAEALIDAGLEGDRYQPRPGGSGKRQVTFIQAEHLVAIGALLGGDAVDPSAIRRNIVVSGINLSALRNRQIMVGSATLLIESSCDPCSRMEEALGVGGYNAMRGHGGWNARVLGGGTIRVHDDVTVVAEPAMLS